MQESFINTLKGVFKMVGKNIIPIILIVIVIICLLVAISYFITIDDALYKENDWSSTNYGASQYINNIEINEDGTLSSNMTAQELWDKMIAEGCRVDKYLDKPEELLKLMRAEIVTQYPDTRKEGEIDKKIDWDKLEENKTLGTIKFKRADEKNNISTITYVTPEEFQGYIDEYNSTGSEEAKKKALSHFTLKKSSNSSSNVINNYGPDLCWPTDSKVITSYFGPRDNPLGEGTENHGAIDIDAPEGTNIYACENGTVIIAGWSDSAGNWVVIDHGNGYVTKYMHNSELKVSEGETVKKGQVIALSGNTGYSDGAHCHFQIEYNGEKVDPLSFKYNNGMGEGTGGFGISDSENTLDKSKLYFIGDSWIAGLQNSGVAETSFFYGQVGKHAGSQEMSISSIPEKSDASAIVLYLGVNNPDTFVEMNSLIDNLATKYGNKPIYVLEVSPVNTDKYSGPVTNEQIHNYNEKVKEHCKSKENVQFLEVASSVTDSNGMLANTSDGLHLNSYQDWYNCIISNIEGSNTNGNSQTESGNSTKKSSTYVAVVATWKQVDTIITTNDPNVKKSPPTQYTMTTVDVNYEEKVQPYTMPFDLLWAFLVIGEEKEFVFDLADLVYDSDIQITIHDNLTVNTDIDEWHYDKRTKAVIKAAIKVTIKDESASGSVHDFHDPHGKDIPLMTTKTVITQKNTVNADLTKADVWFVDHQINYTYSSPTEPISDNTTVVTKKDEEYPESPNSIGNDYSCEHIQAKIQELESIVSKRVKFEDGDTYRDIKKVEKNIEVKYYYKYINIVDNITNKVNSQKYIQGTSVVNEKVEKDSKKPNFVTIYNKIEHKKNRINTESVTSWLFEIIETNESTKDMLDMVKYLLYKATGNDYGKTEFNFEEFIKGRFTKVQGIGTSGLTQDYIAGWENPYLWHYLRNDGVYDYMYSPYIYEGITEDRKYFLCYADGLSKSSGNRNFGFGVLHRYDDGGYNNVALYKKYGIDIDSGAYDELGCKLEVEIVQNVKGDIVNASKSNIKSNYPNLPDNQIDALVAVSYQYGNIGNFEDAYSQYGNTEALRQNFVVNGFLPFLTGYYDSERAEANWDVFSKGIYRLRDGTILDPNSYVANDGEATEMQARIVEIAKSQDTLGTSGGMCQAWVCRVYRKAGQADISSCCASSAGEQWIVSNDQNKIPLGACVYGYSNPTVYDSCGRDAGHVGIYVGDGQVASNVGGIRIESLESWISGFGWKGWGWNGGIDYSK